MKIYTVYYADREGRNTIIKGVLTFKNPKDAEKFYEDRLSKHQFVEILEGDLIENFEDIYK